MMIINYRIIGRRQRVHLIMRELLIKDKLRVDLSKYLADWLELHKYHPKIFKNLCFNKTIDDYKLNNIFLLKHN